MAQTFLKLTKYVKENAEMPLHSVPLEPFINGNVLFHEKQYCLQEK